MNLARNITTAAFLLAAAFAPAQYTLSWESVDSGGGAGTGGVYRVDTTIGQPDAARRMQGGQYSLAGGFRAEALAGGDFRPRLSISREAGGLVVLTWSASTAGYQLEGTNRMPSSPGPWPPVTNSPVITNGRYRVTASGTSTNAFYRLNKP